jgi:hypothetical protein
MNPCKECINKFGKALCEGLKGCVFEDIPNSKVDDFFKDPIHVLIKDQ